MITGNYKNWSTLYRTTSISGDYGRDAGYNGRCYLPLAPKKSFWTVWKNNISEISEEKNNRYYIEEYYKQVLSKLDIERVYKDLERDVLLCYEDSSEFCHRHIVAYYIELLLGIVVEEKTQSGEVLSRPEYIKDVLEEVIKENTDMKGFNSLRALYLFEKGNVFDVKAKYYEDMEYDKACLYRREAAYLRCEADMAEEEYNKKKYVKKLKKND